MFTDLWIPACLLGMYLPMLGLARLGFFRNSPRLLQRLHLGAGALTLLLFALFVLWGLSLRGQWLDVLPLGLAWLAAGAYYRLQRQQLGWAGKLYFRAWFYYPLTLVGVFLWDRIFFAVLSLPLMAFIPETTHFSSSACTIRDTPSGLLGASRVSLLVPVGGIFERHLGTAMSAELPDSGRILNVTIQPAGKPGAIPVRLTTSQGSRPVLFTAHNP